MKKMMVRLIMALAVCMCSALEAGELVNENPLAHQPQVPSLQPRMEAAPNMLNSGGDHNGAGVVVRGVPITPNVQGSLGVGTRLQPHVMPQNIQGGVTIQFGK